MAEKSEKTEKSVRVFCRFRPINQSEIENGGGQKTTRIEVNRTVHVHNSSGESKFEFDYIFPDASTQEEVYTLVGKPLVEEILKGYNATIFAYGQSGSGKTTTMTGHQDDTKPRSMGIVPRVIQDIFQAIKNKKDHQFSIQVSYVEIYLEKIRDLLNPINENLEIRESRYKGIWIDDVTEIYVSSFDEALRVMRKAENNRTVAATAMNSQSSRSHSLLVILLNQTNLKTQAKTTSRMVFVDLAGSEKVEKTKADGLLLKQAQFTNKSLLNLGLVIRALVDKKPHVPYRDSKLTRLLTDSLGGNSKTHLIVTCSPAVYNVEETLNTLRFGSMAQQIKNKPRVNLELNIEEYKRLLLEANQKIATQEMLITALQKDLQVLLGVCEKKGIDVSSFRKAYNVGTPGSGSPEDGKLQHLTEEIESKTTLITDLQKTISRIQKETEERKDLIEILRDDLDHRKEELESKHIEMEELRVKSEDLTRLCESLQRQSEETSRTVQTQLLEEKTRQAILLDENTGLKNKIAQLVEEVQSQKETVLRTWTTAGTVIPSSSVSDEKYTALLRSEEELKQVLEARTRHIKILEESLNDGNGKLQQLTADHKKKNIEYEKRIKDLESQIRILKHATPPSNIIIPLKY